MWLQCEPRDFVSEIQQEFTARIAAGRMPHIAEAETLHHVGDSLFEQSKSKQMAHAARQRAQEIIAAIVAENRQLQPGHDRPGFDAFSSDEAIAVLEAQRVFAHLCTQTAGPAHGEYLYQGARLIDAVDRHYESTLSECLEQPAFARSYAEAQQAAATHAPGLEVYLKHTLIGQLRQGMYPFDLDLTSTEVWQGYVDAAAAARTGAEGPLTGVVGIGPAGSR